MWTAPQDFCSNPLATMKSVIVAISGVNLSHRFVIRELSLYFPAERSHRHYFFDKPSPLYLSPSNKRTEWYSRVVLGEIGIHQRIPGSLTYRAHRDILAGIGADHIIICAGHVAHKFLSAALPYADIVDVQQRTPNFKFPTTLPEVNCGLKTGHINRCCSLAKVLFMSNHVEVNDVIFMYSLM